MSTTLSRFRLEIRRDALDLGLKALQLVRDGAIDLDAAIEIFSDEVEQANTEIQKVDQEPEPAQPVKPRRGRPPRTPEQVEADRQQRAALQERAAQDPDIQKAVLEALATGLSPTRVALAIGLTRALVERIRDARPAPSAVPPAPAPDGSQARNGNGGRPYRRHRNTGVLVGPPVPIVSDRPYRRQPRGTEGLHRTEIEPLGDALDRALGNIRGNLG